MGLNLEEKQAVVAEIGAQVAQAQAIVVAEYRGLGVAAMTDLRKQALNLRNEARMRWIVIPSHLSPLPSRLYADGVSR